MKVYEVSKSRKEYICDKCRETIEKGSSYIWWKPVHERKHRWHIEHGRPPRSMLTSSSHKKRIYEAQEKLIAYLQKIKACIKSDCESARCIEMLENAEEQVVNAACVLNEVSDRYMTSANNVSSRFGKTVQVQDCLRKADIIWEWGEWLIAIQCTLERMRKKIISGPEAVIYSEIEDDLNEMIEIIKEMNL